MLKLKKLYKEFSGVTVVDKFTAAFPAGTISALVGPNGAGKTSIFHLITGEMRADSGSIFYNQEELTRLPAHQVARRGVGRLFQDVRVFANLSAIDNIVTACYAPRQEHPWYPFLHPGELRRQKREITQRAEAVLERFGLVDMKNIPAGELSFGQQKLLAIGRLLAADCSLLLFDEPTAGVNPTLIAKILTIIREIIDEDTSKTVIIVEHNMTVVSEIAQWVFFMNEGRIAFTGRTDHVLGCREVREMYLGLSGDRR